MVLYSWVAILLFMADLDLNRLVTMAFIMKTEKNGEMRGLWFVS